jgi:hypothetical protein
VRYAATFTDENVPNSGIHFGAYKAAYDRISRQQPDGDSPAVLRTPAEVDREFLKIIRNEAEFDDFLERADQIYNRLHG